MKYLNLAIDSCLLSIKIFVLPELTSENGCKLSILGVKVWRGGHSAHSSPICASTLWRMLSVPPLTRIRFMLVILPGLDKLRSC